MGTSSLVTRSITSASLLLALAHGIAGCASDMAPRADDSPDPADQIDEGGAAGPEEPTAEAASALDEVAQWCTDYCYDTGWRTAKHLRRLADVDGDGLIDVVGFNDAGVYVSRSLGSSFAAPEVWLSDFG
jgi:hypothetical protein